MAAKQKATVSGGSLDRAYDSAPIALSAAITFASRMHEDATLYVREADGSPYGRVERHDSEILIYSKGARP